MSDDFDETEAIKESIARLNDRMASVQGQLRGTTERSHNITESADKIRLKTKITRGEGTRDQDKIEVTVKGDDPDAAVEQLNATLENLRETAEAARAIQPGAEDEDGEADD